MRLGDVVGVTVSTVLSTVTPPGSSLPGPHSALRGHSQDCRDYPPLLTIICKSALNISRILDKFAKPSF